MELIQQTQWKHSAEPSRDECYNSSQWDRDIRDHHETLFEGKQRATRLQWLVLRRWNNGQIYILGNSSESASLFLAIARESFPASTESIENDINTEATHLNGIVPKVWNVPKLSSVKWMLVYFEDTGGNMLQYLSSSKRTSLSFRLMHVIESQCLAAVSASRRYRGSDYVNTSVLSRESGYHVRDIELQAIPRSALDVACEHVFDECLTTFCFLSWSYIISPNTENAIQLTRWIPIHLHDPLNKRAKCDGCEERYQKQKK